MCKFPHNNLTFLFPGVCPLEVLGFAVEVARLKSELEKKERTITWLREQLIKKERKIQSLNIVWGMYMK